MVDKDNICFAGGGLVWRIENDALTLAVVHRPKYDDWSLPKGKVKESLDRTLEDTALRETEEETGWRVAIIDFAGEVTYPNKEKRKIVRFYNMKPVEQTGEPDPGEVDRIRWLTPPESLETLSYEHDRMLVRENAERIGKKIFE